MNLSSVSQFMNMIRMMVLPALSSLVETLLVLLLLDVIGRCATAFSKSLLNARVRSAEARFDVCDCAV